MYTVATITAYKHFCRFEVREGEKVLHNGSSSLGTFNGDYDALLTHILNMVAKYRPDEFLYRRR